MSVLLPFWGFSQAVLINEVMSANRNTLIDEDGNTSDWIELYNASDQAIDLTGMALSDDLTDPFKWSFASGQIGSHEHLLIFASGADKQGTDLSWHPVIHAGDMWNYLVGTYEPPATWKTLTFEDGTWASGPTGIGYGDGDDATQIPPTLALYMRKTFAVEDASAVYGILFHMDVDDGYIAYLNGEEIARQNMGVPGSFYSYESTATTYTEPLLPQGYDLPPHLLTPDLLLNGQNVLALQVHNSGTTSSDLTALPFLSLGMGTASSESMPEYLTLPEGGEYHTSFRLNQQGESLYLSSADGALLDSVAIPELESDMSWARNSDGAGNWVYANPSTPGYANSGGTTTLAFFPIPSYAPGFYDNPIAVTFNIPSDGSTLRFTTNGNKPDIGSPVFSGPIILNNSTPLRVRSSNPDGSHQRYATYSFFINEPRTLPVVALVFEPDDFFDNDSGIYVLGDSYDPSFPYFGANFWEDWERPVHIEYFQNTDTLSYAAPGGAKIFGGWSRGQAQRSLSLYARNSYGTNAFDYPFFAEREYEKYEALVLRNAGNDWPQSGYRDVFMNSLIAHRDLERQAFEPVEVYFNGDYWGIYNLREKVNEHMIASQADIEPNSLDLLEMNGTAIHGQADSYWDLINFVETHTLGSETDFEYVRDRVDLDNFIEYQFAQIYFDNRDWPGNNIKFWKSHAPDGRWRWILYDTDFGFGIWDANAYTFNTLAFATATNGPGWPNPPWSTLLLRKFLNNINFRNAFILKACDMLNTDFQPQRVLQLLDERRNALLTSILRHIDRWQMTSINNWNYHYSIMQVFAEERPAYMRDHLQAQFNLGEAHPLTVQVEPPGSGLVQVHSIRPDAYPWTGIYFPGVPVDVTALAAAGYAFSHWEGIPSSNPDLLMLVDAPRTLTAVFEAQPGTDRTLVLNEINYHASEDQDAKDWLEIYNYGTETQDINGWYLSDSNDENVFFLPDLQLQPSRYLVVTTDSLAFRAIHGDGMPLAGDLDFNFSNGGELIRLFDPLGAIVDSVRYDDDLPWPSEPDGNGHSLELIHPSLDNGLASSWGSSEGIGTPGAQNSIFSIPDAVDPGQIPSDFRLRSIFPNPFNAQVTISFSVPSEQPLDLKIYDLLGRLVVRQELEITPGTGRFIWNGLTASGQTCASGVYLVSMTQEGHSVSGKIALIR